MIRTQHVAPGTQGAVAMSQPAQIAGRGSEHIESSDQRQQQATDAVGAATASTGAAAASSSVSSSGGSRHGAVLLQELLGRRADPNLLNARERTALDVAHMSGRPAIIRDLEDHRSGRCRCSCCLRAPCRCSSCICCCASALLALPTDTLAALMLLIGLIQCYMDCTSVMDLIVVLTASLITAHKYSLNK